jgi:choice-of-anchor A domain-containing protein
LTFAPVLALAGGECGNGKVEYGEQCDDGNTNNGDGCSSTCQIEPSKCGNRNVEPGEQCDDGNTDNGDGCSSTCQYEPKCGNGKIEPGEQCDDGNTEDGDGCSATCTCEDDICVNANPLLQEARSCTVLQLGGAKVDMTGPAGGIVGDVCIGANGKLSMSGSQFVNGRVRLATGATFSHSGSTTVGGVDQGVDLSGEIAAALTAANNASGRACTQTFVSLKNSQTIFGNGGVNVICVGSVEVASNALIILAGGLNDSFIINVTGKFKINGSDNGGKILVAGEVEPRDVLYNVIGTGEDVAFSGGGGVGCCKARVDGTILAPLRKIAMSPGLVNGQIISGRDISIVSGSALSCPLPEPECPVVP